MTMDSPVFIPQWPAPNTIKAYSTIRYPGKSLGVYAGFNLALHVGDESEHVLFNRERLMQVANLHATPKWLNQTHSEVALPAETISTEIVPNADASYTRKPNQVCVVMTADCLPILVTNKDGTEIAAIHAGWQGLAAGVIENTLSALTSLPENLLIWLGPSIHQANYEVGEDFYMKFAEKHSSKECDAAFILKDKRAKKWLANVPLLAIQRLVRMGVFKHNIYWSHECTYANPDKYFSYRRDSVTGRMASLIWIDK